MIDLSNGFSFTTTNTNNEKLLNQKSESLKKLKNNIQTTTFENINDVINKLQNWSIYDLSSLTELTTQIGQTVSQYKELTNTNIKIESKKLDKEYITIENLIAEGSNLNLSKFISQYSTKLSNIEFNFGAWSSSTTCRIGGTIEDCLNSITYGVLGYVNRWSSIALNSSFGNYDNSLDYETLYNTGLSTFRIVNSTIASIYKIYKVYKAIKVAISKTKTIFEFTKDFALTLWSGGTSVPYAAATVSEYVAHLVELAIRTTYKIIKAKLLELKVAVPILVDNTKEVIDTASDPNVPINEILIDTANSTETNENEEELELNTNFIKDENNKKILHTFTSELTIKSLIKNLNPVNFQSNNYANIKNYSITSNLNSYQIYKYSQMLLDTDTDYSNELVESMLHLTICDDLKNDGIIYDSVTHYYNRELTKTNPTSLRKEYKDINDKINKYEKLLYALFGRHYIALNENIPNLSNMYPFYDGWNYDYDNTKLGQNKYISKNININSINSALVYLSNNSQNQNSYLIDLLYSNSYFRLLTNNNYTQNVDINLEFSNIANVLAYINSDYTTLQDYTGLWFSKFSYPRTIKKLELITTLSDWQYIATDLQDLEKFNLNENPITYTNQVDKGIRYDNTIFNYGKIIKPDTSNIPSNITAESLKNEFESLSKLYDADLTQESDSSYYYKKNYRESYENEIVNQRYFLSNIDIDKITYKNSKINSSYSNKLSLLKTKIPFKWGEYIIKTDNEGNAIKKDDGNVEYIFYSETLNDNKDELLGYENNIFTYWNELTKYCYYRKKSINSPFYLAVSSELLNYNQTSLTTSSGQEFTYCWSKLTTTQINNAKENKSLLVTQDNLNDEYNSSALFKLFLINKEVGSNIVTNYDDFLKEQRNSILDLDIMSVWELFTTKTDYLEYNIEKQITFFNKNEGKKDKNDSFEEKGQAKLYLKHKHYDYETKPIIYIDSSNLTESSNIYIVSDHPLNRKESENYNDLTDNELLNASGTNASDLFNENFIISITNKSKQESLYCKLKRFYYFDFNSIFTTDKSLGLCTENSVDTYSEYITRKATTETINNKEILNLNLSYNEEYYKHKYKPAFVYIIKLSNTYLSNLRLPLYINKYNNTLYNTNNLDINDLFENTIIKIANALSLRKNDISSNNTSIRYFKNHYLTRSYLIDKTNNLYGVPALVEYIQRDLLNSANIEIKELYTKTSTQVIKYIDKEYNINTGARLFYNNSQILYITDINNNLPFSFTLCSDLIDLVSTSKGYAITKLASYNYSSCDINNKSSLIYLSNVYFIEQVLENYDINLKKLKTWNFWKDTSIEKYFNNLNLWDKVKSPLNDFLNITNTSSYTTEIPKLVLLVIFWKKQFNDFIRNINIYDYISKDSSNNIIYNYRTLESYLSSSMISDCIVLPSINENIENLLLKDNLDKQDWENILNFYKNIESDNTSNINHIINYLPRPNCSIIIIDNDDNRIEFVTITDFLDYFWNKDNKCANVINIKNIYFKTTNNYTTSDITTYTDLIENNNLPNILNNFDIIYEIANNTKTELIELEKELRELRNILLAEYSDSSKYEKIIYDSTISGETFNNEFIYTISTLDPDTKTEKVIDDERLTEYLNLKLEYKEKYILTHDFNYLLSRKEYLSNLINDIEKISSINIFETLANKINYIKKTNAEWLNIETEKIDYDYFLEDCYKTNNKEKLNISTLKYLKSYILTLLNGKQLENNEIDTGLYQQRLDIMLLRANSDLGYAYTKIKSLEKINSQKSIELKNKEKELYRKQVEIDTAYDLEKLIYKEGHFYNYSLIEKIKKQIGEHCLLTCTSCSVKDTCPFYDEDGIIKKYLPDENMLTLYFKDNKLTIIKSLPSELSYLENLTEIHNEDNIENYINKLENSKKDNLVEHNDYIVGSYLGNINKLISNNNMNSKYISNLVTLPFRKNKNNEYEFDTSSSFSYSSDNNIKIKYNEKEYSVEVEKATSFNLFNQNKDYPVYLVGDYLSQEYNDTYLVIYLGHLSDLRFSINEETQSFTPKTLQEDTQSCINNDNSFFETTRINKYGVLVENRKQVNLNCSFPMIINQNLINDDLVDNNYQTAKPITIYLKGLSLDINSFKWTDKEYSNTKSDLEQKNYDIENAKFKLAELTQYGSNIRLVIVKK